MSSLEVVSVLHKDKHLEVAVVKHTPSGQQYIRKWVHGSTGEEQTLAAAERAWLDGRITKAQRERIVMVGPKPWVHTDWTSPKWPMGTSCIVTEKLERTLDDKAWLKAHPPSSATVAGWCADIVAALWTLHSTTGVAHNDVAPANIGLRADGRAVLTGLGMGMPFMFGHGPAKARVCLGSTGLWACGRRPYAARALFGKSVREHPCDDLESLVYAMTELLSPGYVLPWGNAPGGVNTAAPEDISMEFLTQPLPPSKAAFKPPQGAEWLGEVLKVIDGAQACRAHYSTAIDDPGMPLKQGLMVKLYAKAHSICLEAMKDDDAAGAAARIGDRPTKPARYHIPARCNSAEKLADPKQELVWLNLYKDGSRSKWWPTLISMLGPSVDLVRLRDQSSGAGTVGAGGAAAAAAGGGGGGGDDGAATGGGAGGGAGTGARAPTGGGAGGGAGAWV